MTSTSKSTVNSRVASGVGLATVVDAGERAGTVLDVFYPAPALSANPDASYEADLRVAATTDPDRNVRSEIVTTVIDLDEAPRDTADAYLRLHLLSHRLAQPNTLNLDGIFALLPNNAWTPAPLAPSTAPSMRWNAFRWPPASSTAIATGWPMARALASAAAMTVWACCEVSCMDAPCCPATSSSDQRSGSTEFFGRGC